MSSPCEATSPMTTASSASTVGTSSSCCQWPLWSPVSLGGKQGGWLREGLRASEGQRGQAGEPPSLGAFQAGSSAPPGAVLDSFPPTWFSQLLLQTFPFRQRGVAGT